MKDILKIIGKSILSAIFFGLTLILVVYAVNQFPTKVNDGETLTQNTINSIIDYLVPVGAIIPFNSANCPNGWIKADGQNGTPDLRGEFIRGWDDNKGTDSGRILGSGQEDTLQNIVGNIYNAFTHANSGGSTDGVFNSSNNNVLSSNIGSGGGYDNSFLLSFDASRVARTSSETRPRNIALLYCVKQ